MTLTPFLYHHQNPNALRRSNGIRFHGYPRRTKRVRLIVIHTAESTPDYVGEDGGAEAVAAYQARVERPSSYHELIDSDSHVVMLPPEAVAFGARGANADGWHLSFATQAHLWPNKPQAWRDAALSRAAGRARAAADLHGIPIRRLSRSEIADGRTKGLVAHADTEAVFGKPGRRSDPGGAFPWGEFLNLMDGGIMATLDDEDIDRIADAVSRRVWREDIAGVTAQTLLNQAHRAATEVRDGKVGDRNANADWQGLRFGVRDLLRRAGAKVLYDPPDEHGV